MDSRPTDERRANYVETAGQDYFMVRLIREAIEDALQQHAQASGLELRALDVGCGAQPFRASLESLKYQYTGFDVVQNQAGSIDVLGAIDEPISESLRQRGPYQLILCTEVLEHVADWKTAFANFRQLLAPGGKLLITCPQFWPLHEVPYDFWRPTLFAIRKYAEAQGMQILEEHANGTSREVIYTALASCPFAARRNTLWCKLVRSMCVIVRRTLVRLLRSDWLDRAVVMNGGLSLSNFAVIVRPD